MFSPYPRGKDDHILLFNIVALMNEAFTELLRFRCCRKTPSSGRLDGGIESDDCKTCSLWFEVRASFHPISSNDLIIVKDEWTRLHTVLI